jgi:putative SOS response-associated peptidase YedK
VCNDFGNNISYSNYLAAFSQTRTPVKWPSGAPNLEPRDDIWPTERAPVIRRLQDGTNEFSELRWGVRSADMNITVEVAVQPTSEVHNLIGN